MALTCRNIEISSFTKAEVDADSLQMLHAAHNLLEVVDHAKERQLSAATRISPAQASTRLRNGREPFLAVAYINESTAAALQISAAW